MFAELMARVAAGDPEAARELHDRYGEHVRRVVRRRLHVKLRARFDSLDFTQDVWASFFARPGAAELLRKPEDLTAYLTRVASNKVIDALRHCMTGQKHDVNREKSLEAGLTHHELEELLSAVPTPSQVAIATETWQTLLARTPLVHRGILQMHREGHRPAEIAALLKLSEKTVRRVIQTFIEKLDP